MDVTAILEAAQDVIAEFSRAGVDLSEPTQAAGQCIPASEAIVARLGGETFGLGWSTWDSFYPGSYRADVGFAGEHAGHTVAKVGDVCIDVTGAQVGEASIRIFRLHCGISDALIRSSQRRQMLTEAGVSARRAYRIADGFERPLKRERASLPPRYEILERTWEEVYSSHCGVSPAWNL